MSLFYDQCPFSLVENSFTERIIQSIRDVASAAAEFKKDVFSVPQTEYPSLPLYEGRVQREISHKQDK